MLKRRMKILQRKTGMVDPPLRLQLRNKPKRLAKVRVKPAILRSLKRLICASRPCKRLSYRKRSAGSKTWPKRTRRIKILTCLMGAVAANLTMRKGPSVSMPSILFSFQIYPGGFLLCGRSSTRISSLCMLGCAYCRAGFSGSLVF